MTPTVGAKRVRTTGPDQLGILQQSPVKERPALDSEPADVLAFFAERGSRAHALQTEIAQLQERTQQQAAQLETAQLRAAALQAENSRLAALAEAQSNQAAHERRKLQSTLEAEFKRTAELTRQIEASNQQQRRHTAADQATASDTAHSGQKADSATVRQLQEDIEQLQQQLRHQTDEVQELRRRREQEQQHAQRQTEADKHLCRELQQQLDDALGIAGKANAAKSEALQRAAAAEQRAAAAESAAANSSNDQELRNLREELAASEQLVREARRLKEYVSNAEILKEKLHAEQQRAQRAKAALDAAGDAKAEVAGLEAQLAHWRDFYKGVAEVQKPEDLLHRLQQLQQDSIVQNERLAKAAATADSLQSQVRTAEQRQQEHEAALAAAHAAREEACATAARLDRQLALLGKERDGLKRILASYQQDDARSDVAERDALAAARTQALEGALESLQGQLSQLEAALAAKAAEASAQQAAAAAAAQRADAADARAQELEREAEQLGQQVANMQARLGRGEFNPETTRVLHFVRNPEAEAQRQMADARIAELDAENKALRSQLQQLEAQQQSAPAGAAAAAPGSEPGMAKALAEAEIAIVKRKLAEAEKREMRLKEIFNKQIVNFREACFFLFGYRVDMASKATAAAGAGTAATTFVLTPQHGDERTQLLFALKPKGMGMELLPSEYVTKRLKQEVDMFIVRFKSISAFTANLTLENFQKHTSS